MYNQSRKKSEGSNLTWVNVNAPKWPRWKYRIKLVYTERKK